MYLPKEKEAKAMRTNFYLDGKKITKKAATEMVGADRLKRMIEESKEEFFQDPLTENSYFIGNGMLTIEFK